MGSGVEDLNEVFLIYVGGEGGFRSALVFGRAQSFWGLVELIWGVVPDDFSEEFDDMVSLKNDFFSEGLWREGGNLWEADFSTGFAGVVKVDSLLN